MVFLSRPRPGNRIVRLLAATLLVGAVVPSVHAQLAGLASVPIGTRYALAAGDAITITVLRHPEFSGEFAIPTSGIIDVPAVGDVWVLGATLSDVGKKVADKLKTRLLHPEVSVRLTVSRGLKVSVLGDVKTAGTYEIRTGWGVAEVLSAAGGLAADVQRKDVRVVLDHLGQRTQEPLEEALSGPRDLSVQPGDVLSFYAVQTQPVYVTGKVKSPGMYKLREDSTGLLAALAQAGGVTDDAALANVRVVHATGGEETVDLTPALVRGESSKLPRLSPGDMVVVSETLARYAVLGYVQKPGTFPLPQGRPITLSDAVAQAQGTDKRAKISKIGLVHTGPDGKQGQRVYDLGKFLKGGDVSQNPTIEAGDVVYVPETGRADNGTIFSALGASVGFLNLFRRY